MPAYVFHLYDGPGVTPLDEAVTAVDLEEARDLAQLRLLLSAQFTHVEVFEGGALRLNLERDGSRAAPDSEQSRNPTKER